MAVALEPGDRRHQLASFRKPSGKPLGHGGPAVPVLWAPTKASSLLRVVPLHLGPFTHPTVRMVAGWSYSRDQYDVAQTARGGGPHQQAGRVGLAVVTMGSSTCGFPLRCQEGGRLQATPSPRGGAGLVPLWEGRGGSLGFPGDVVLRAGGLGPVYQGFF